MTCGHTSARVFVATAVEAAAEVAGAEEAAVEAAGLLEDELELDEPHAVSARPSPATATTETTIFELRVIFPTTSTVMSCTTLAGWPPRFNMVHIALYREK
jgi:hypothetical protein